MSALTGSVIAGCDIQEHLGSGAVGAVYGAIHRESGKRVAIKVITVDVAARPEFLERFQREARLAYQLDHPHIVRVLTWGEDAGQHYVVMEWIEGSSLIAMIRHHGNLAWKVVAGLGRQVAEALAHVHALGLVHRDVKPANILVGRDGAARLADLGLARQLVDSPDEVGGRRATAPGTAMGSPCYMAPEQITDTAAVGPPADVYALAASLFHALAGRPPLTGLDVQDVLGKVLDETPRRASTYTGDLPTAFSDLLASCLVKDPVARPDAAAVEQALRGIMRS